MSVPQTSVQRGSPFKFLGLPLEMRRLIYEHLFTNEEDIRPYAGAGQDAATSISILLVNKEIYEEASDVLYSKKVFRLEISQYDSERFDDPTTIFRRVGQRVNREKIRNLNIDVFWPHLSVYGDYTPQSLDAVALDLQTLIKNACTGLASFQKMKSINVDFDVCVSLTTLAGISRVRRLLLPFEWLQSRRPDMRITVADLKGIVNPGSDDPPLLGDCMVTLSALIERAGNGGIFSFWF